jgi:hypothetical protein
MRCYGFDPRGHEVVHSEAEIIREVATRVPAGEKTLKILVDLRERDVRSATGAHWTLTWPRRLLRNPRLAGVPSPRDEAAGRSGGHPSSPWRSIAVSWRS